MQLLFLIASCLSTGLCFFPLRSPDTQFTPGSLAFRLSRTFFFLLLCYFGTFLLGFSSDADNGAVNQRGTFLLQGEKRRPQAVALALALLEPALYPKALRPIVGRTSEKPHHTPFPTHDHVTVNGFIQVSQEPPNRQEEAGHFSEPASPPSAEVGETTQHEYKVGEGGPCHG